MVAIVRIVLRRLRRMSMTENKAIQILKNLVIEGGDKSRAKVAVDMAIQALEENQEFHAIGTIEDFKALKEKNEPYKPQEYEDRYYACKCDNILLPKWRKYPTELMPKTEGLPHCMACGQKLDWSE